MQPNRSLVHNIEPARNIALPKKILSFLQRNDVANLNQVFQDFRTKCSKDFRLLQG